MPDSEVGLFEISRLSRVCDGDTGYIHRKDD